MKKYSKKQIEILEKFEISCADHEKLMNDLVDGELPETLAQRINQHSAECLGCQSELSQLLFLKEIAKSLALPPLSDERKKRLHDKLNAELGLSL